jgi:BlaI family transcriptional regulator, penicillinase repressor
MKGPFDKVAESELQILKVLWASKVPLSSSQIVAAVSAVTTWEATTIRTLIHRLLIKGVLKAEKRDVQYYRPTVTEAAFGKHQTARLLDTFYSGKAANLFSALYQQKQLSAADIAELRALLEKEIGHE